MMVGNLDVSQFSTEKSIIVILVFFISTDFRFWHFVLVSYSDIDHGICLVFFFNRFLVLYINMNMNMNIFRYRPWRYCFGIQISALAFFVLFVLLQFLVLYSDMTLLFRNSNTNLGISTFRLGSVHGHGWCR